ncbi:MAG: cation diffusion facilitator family transporter [Planctomycetota bacterium]|jgi:cation diffusion facilitator family transporter
MSASGSKFIIYAALIGNALISVTKFVAATITGSSAMLSEGIHSLVDTGNQVLLLLGLKRAAKPADAQFPFGHGKEVYFWSFVVAILIFAVGAGISLYEGIIHLQHPSEIESVMVNYIVLGLALLFEGIVWLVAMREFTRAKGKWGFLEAVKRSKDPSIFVVVFEDSAAMLGLLVALLGVMCSHLWGIWWADGAASIVIGLILAGTAIWLAYETKSLLIGESANPEEVEGMRRLVSAFPEVTHVNEVLTMHMGPDFVLANLSVDFRDGVDSAQVEETIARMDRSIKELYPVVKRVFVEAESRNRA